MIRRSLLLVLLICAPLSGNAQIVLRGATLRGAVVGTTNVTSGGGGGGDFLTGIGFRYVADNTTGSDGTAIATWPDSSGNSHDATQATGANQPLTKVAAVNGHRAVQFDGSNDSLVVSVAATTVSGATACTVFVVLKQDSTGAENTPVCWQDSADATHCIRLHASFDDVIYWDAPFAARISHAQPVGWDDAWHIIECYRNGANSEVLVDGVSLVSSSSVSGSFTQSGTDNLAIGAVDTTGGAAQFNFKGQIAEVRIWNTAVGSTDRATVRAFLKSTYGTP